MFRWSSRSYQRLPTNIVPRKQSQSRLNVILGITILLLAVTVIILLRMTLRPVYRPLDDYQIMNTLPVIQEAAGPSPRLNRHAVATTLYSDSYAIAAAVLGHSIRSVNSTARLVLLYIDGQASQRALCVCKAVGWETLAMPRIPPPHGEKSVRKQFVDQYTKLNLWGLDKHGIDSVVYLDADTLVRRNFDELFSLPFNFAAVPDVYGPGDVRGFDITFNAGVIALKTSSAALDHMKEMIGEARYPQVQAEQAFLNMYFGAKAARLPYIYNANIAIKQRNSAVWEELKRESSIVHYTMSKPFLGLSFPDNTPSDEEIERALDHISISKNDDWAEELGWWYAAFRGTMKKYGSVIAKCAR